MIVYPPEEVSSRLYCSGVFEPDVTSALLTLIEPGMGFYDVGAHYGYFTLLAAQLVGETGRVHAFEPVPRTFGVLEQNASGLRNVRLNQAAVFSTVGTLEIHDYGPLWSAFSSFTDPRRKAIALTPECTHCVRAVSLDSYCDDGRPPDFVKIDAESAELDVLQGMTAIIKCSRPIVTLEVGDEARAPGLPPSRVPVEFLLAREYQVFSFSEGRWVPHKPQESYRYGNLLFIPGEKATVVCQRGKTLGMIEAAGGGR